MKWIFNISPAHLWRTASGYQGSLWSLSCTTKKKVERLYPRDSYILSNLSSNYSILSGRVIFILFIYWYYTSFQKESQAAGERIRRKRYTQVVMPKLGRGFFTFPLIVLHYTVSIEKQYKKNRLQK